MTDLDRLIKLVSENPNYMSTKISNKIQSLKSQIEAEHEIIKLFVKWNENKIDDTTFAQKSGILLGERYNQIAGEF